MPNVEISINGRLYTVACDEGQQGRIRELGGIFDAKVQELTGGAPAPGAVGEAHVLVLAGLMLADEVYEARAGTAQPEEPVSDDRIEHGDLLVAAVDHLVERIGLIADRLDRP